MYTLDDTRKLLGKAVEQRGAEWEYPVAPEGSGSSAETEWLHQGACVYALREKDAEGNWVRTDKPACIVGVVAHEVGLFDQLEEGRTADLQEVLADNFTWQAIELLRAVQKHQDIGLAWGYALGSAWEDLQALMKSDPDPEDESND